MKRYVSVSAFEFSTKWPSDYYIHNDYRLDVKCTIESCDKGLLFNKYFLKLEGTEENIQVFIDYLKHEGFKIK